MTMVAAFKINGIPVLIGDFLTTDKQLGKRNSFLPTAPTLSKSIPAPGRSRIHGTRRKLHKIGDRLVVGFTGSLVPGAYLIRRLYERFSGSAVTISDLENFLSMEQYPRKDETHLVGWVWGNRPICFQWSGANSNGVEQVESAFAGSGANHFRNEVLPSDYTMGCADMRTAIDSAIYQSVGHVGRALQYEILDASNLAYDYGYGAELIVWNGAAFSYIPKTIYTFWNIVINRDNTFSITPSNRIGIYCSYDNHAVVEITHMAPSEKPGGGITATDKYIQVITPIHDEMASFDPSSVPPATLDAPIWFTGMTISNPAKSAEAISHMVSECREGIEPFICVLDGHFKIDLRSVRELIPPSFFN